MITSNTNNYILICILVCCYQHVLQNGRLAGIQTITTDVIKMFYSLVHVND